MKNKLSKTELADLIAKIDAEKQHKRQTLISEIVQLDKDIANIHLLQNSNFSQEAINKVVDKTVGTFLYDLLVNRYDESLVDDLIGTKNGNYTITRQGKNAVIAEKISKLGNESVIEYVTWTYRIQIEGGKPSYDWGRYSTDLDTTIRNFMEKEKEDG